MGIQDRDYMRRPPPGDEDDEDDGGERSDPAESRTEAALERFQERHPRFFLWLWLGLSALILVGLAAVRVADAGH